MKSIKQIFIVAVLSLAFTFGFSQNQKLREATKEYDNFSYVKTSEILLEVANGGYKSVDLFQKLGNSFYFNNQLEEAAKWYGELMAMDEVKGSNNLDPEYYYRYAQSLKALENYTESDAWMKKFSEASKDDLRARNFNAKGDYLKSIEKVSEDFEVINVPFNTEVSDFGASEYNGRFIFSSSRQNGKVYKWNNQPYLELYEVSKVNDSTYSDVEKFNKTVNTKYHESSVAFTPNGETMYFTRNNYFKSKLKRDDAKINRLHLYSARLKGDDSWGDIESVYFNDESHSVAHPTINAIGNKLIFASDMPGTLGQSDLYIVEIKTDGSLGVPQNLGANLNTEAQETFPFINKKGDLYFSSNGYSGLGGLDVYVVRDFENKFNKNERFVVENLGKPINSPKDDFAYYENLITKEGYFSSNRDGGQGDDDIYTFNIPECIQRLTGVVTDKATQELLPGASVALYDASNVLIEEQIVGDDATYNFQSLKCDSNYLVRASKETYSSSEERITSSSNRKEYLVLDFELEKDEVVIAEGTNLRDALNLNPIYFDFDKHNIRPDAELELQKVIAVLKKYPSMHLDVKSHTDSRAPMAYNDQLSTRRNTSTINYIVKVGKIDASRLTGKGYGERELINTCSDGVKCTEEEHQLNRRSDFIVVKM